MPSRRAAWDRDVLIYLALGWRRRVRFICSPSVIVCEVCELLCGSRLTGKVCMCVCARYNSMHLAACNCATASGLLLTKPLLSSRRSNFRKFDYRLSACARRLSHGYHSRCHFFTRLCPFFSCRISPNTSPKRRPVAENGPTEWRSRNQSIRTSDAISIGDSDTSGDNKPSSHDETIITKSPTQTTLVSCR